MGRPRGVLTATEARTLDRARDRMDDATAAYQSLVVDVLARGASFAEMRKHTGHSVDTLQRWRREIDFASPPPNP